MKEICPRVFEHKGRIFTKNLTPGKSFFGEELANDMREWDPTRSKACAALKKGLKLPIKPTRKILYLGAGHGYTCSYFSDICRKGIIYAVEFSSRALRELLKVCMDRSNLVPLLADARKPSQYGWIEPVDIVYCDLAQPDEPEIALRNCNFLKKDGWLAVAIKARSIDVTKDPSKIYESVCKKLSKELEIKKLVDLEPYEKAHALILAKAC